MNRQQIEIDLDCVWETIKIAGGLLELNQNKNKYPELVKFYNDLEADLLDQQLKLKKDAYEIAVVGRQKAGKSSLLNAWIKFHLSPVKRDRCTYTTFEIRSCIDISQQRYLIEYFSEQEFEEKYQLTKQNYENANKSDATYNSYEEELKEINSVKDKIYAFVGKKCVEKYFENFEDVQNELHAAISDPGQARAIRKICIWTPILNSEENVVLYDVPGYDAPITFHKDLTKSIIERVDAVLYVTKFSIPTSTDTQVEILNIINKSNTYIQTKDKMIVVLTGCDEAKSKDDFNDLLKKNFDVWRSLGVERIVPVCSLAEFGSNIEEVEMARARLKEFNCQNNGIAELKYQVKSCVEYAKNKIAKQRCDDLKMKICDFANKFTSQLRSDYDIDNSIKSGKIFGDEEIDRKNNEWWTKEWRLIQEEFENFYSKIIRPKQHPDVIAVASNDLLKLRIKYEEIIDSEFKSLKTTKREKIMSLYKTVSEDKGILNTFEANSKIRKIIASECYDCIELISKELSRFLWESIDKMVTWMTRRLYNMPEIREEMIGDNVYEETLMRKGFDSLLQQISRPAISILIQFPRSRNLRLKVLNAFQMDLMTLDCFYEDNRIKSRGLAPFVANGKHEEFSFTFNEANVPNNVLPEENRINADQPRARSFMGFGKKSRGRERSEKNDSQNVLAQHEEDAISNNGDLPELPATFFRNEEGNNQFAKLKFTSDANNINQVVDEIEADLNEFIACMKNSVYHGSRVEEFFNQELYKYKRKFLKLEKDKRYFHHLITKYLKKNDPRVKIPIPDVVEEIALKRRIFNDMQKLKELTNDLK